MAYWEASTYHREDGGNAHLVATFTASDIPLSEIDLLDLLDGRLPRRGRGIKGGAQRLKVVSQNKSNLPGQIEYYLAEYERRDLRPGPMRVRRAFLAEQTYAEAIKDMPWKGIVHSNATVANLIRKAEIRVLPAVIVVDDKV